MRHEWTISVVEIDIASDAENHERLQLEQSIVWLGFKTSFSVEMIIFNNFESNEQGVSMY